MPEPSRVHYLDNLRALAMLSGVLFHAGLAYSPLAHEVMPTADRQSAAVVDAGLWLLHLFRMPLFFVVAGFFAVLLVAKRGMGGLFRDRLVRVALPFVVFLPLVHAALGYTTLQAAATVRHPSPVLALIRELSQGQGLPEQLPGTGHLWFLYYLMFFYVLAWAAQTFELDRLAARLRGLGPAWLLGLLPVLLVPAFAAVSAPHPAPESFFPQFWAFGLYGPFFVLGYLLHGHDAMIERLRPHAPWLAAASLLLYGAFWFLLERSSPIADDPSASWPLACVEACISVWMTVACLVAGKSLLNRANAVLRYLSEVSYWTYLVHLPILFALQYRLLDVEWPWGLKLAAAVLATFALCLLSYHALVRRTFVGSLLGGRANSRAPYSATSCP